MNSGHIQPYLLADWATTETALSLTRCSIAPASPATPAKYDERSLQNLIAAHPEILPIGAIEPALAAATTICTELRTPSGGYIDNLLATGRGDLILVECKLWRSPQARREVVGQIIEYAKDFSRWNYEGLDEAIRRAAPRAGVEKPIPFYDRIIDPEKLDEAAFIDAISRNLRRARVLLLIVGDGIRENVESLADFLQQHAGLHFTLALIELAVYELPEGRGFLVNPSVLARTKMIERGVVSVIDDSIRVQATSAKAAATATLTQQKQIAASITEEIFLERLDENELGLADKLQKALQQFRDVGITTEMLTASMRLHGRSDGEQWPLATIQASD